MKKIISTLTIVIFISSFCFFALRSATTNVMDKPSATPTYEDIYYTKVVADLSKFTTLSKRTDQKEYETVQRLMLIFLKEDLNVIESRTNYAWSPDEKKAIALAKDYLEKVQSKKSAINTNRP